MFEPLKFNNKNLKLARILHCELQNLENPVAGRNFINQTSKRLISFSISAPQKTCKHPHQPVDKLFLVNQHAY